MPITRQATVVDGRRIGLDPELNTAFTATQVANLQSGIGLRGRETEPVDPYPEPYRADQPTCREPICTCEGTRTNTEPLQTERIRTLFNTLHHRMTRLERRLELLDTHAHLEGGRIVVDPRDLLTKEYYALDIC
jgi:hypothetical protein